MKTNNIEKSYAFTLFAAEGEPNSELAKRNLAHICQTYLDQNYEIKVIDVLQDFQKALEKGIFITPTLIAFSLGREITIVGNLSNTQKVLAALGLTEGGKSNE